ncbi:Outer-membrane lipoprotein carrier protein [Candidatus Erwinia haradaeae]|uniref:Outer-membrane lipoprotein carrier protein n=1 Tax=Candidatus Erwinia haradaeae TaxID=1922217 RepID=A0A451D1X6_9GAMM|nr:Outer-membrane lipoprotein carrier protein [Candidatus Erwinia haradaeae]
MNKICIAICLLVFILISIDFVHADTINILQQRLNKLHSFHANFHQKVISQNNSTIQEGDGYVLVEKPNRLLWHMRVPSENVLISDGHTIWAYTPCIEQVSIYSMNKNIYSTPLILIACNEIRYWKQYNISKKGNNFSFIPRKSLNNIKKFTINISKNGIINMFRIIEKDDVCVLYTLSKQKINPISSEKFHFVIPYGVTVDDQR